MIAWYDPGAKTVRYKSTRQRKMADAKLVLAKFQLPENAISLAPAPATKHSFVYFIGGDSGAIKIGTARKPATRLATLQACSPVPLRILALGVGTHRDELIYHKRFAEHRLHGEWFDRSPDIMAEIERLNASVPA